jgi:hypothetical protein
MKSIWLPTMPLHVAHWMADPRVRMLSELHRCRLLDSLAQSWMLGRAVPWMAQESKEYPQPLRETFLLWWGQLLAVRQQHEDAFAKKQQQTAKARASVKKPGRKPRQKKSVTDFPTDSVTDTETDSGQISVSGDEQILLQTVTSSSSSSLTTSKTELATLVPFPPDKPAATRETWITPFCEAWEQRTGGEMSVKPALGPLSRLIAKHGEDRTFGAWLAYLAATPVEFCSVTHFSSKFGQWDGTALPPEAREVGIARELVAEEQPVDLFLAGNVRRLR